MTPVTGAHDEQWLARRERDLVIDKLIAPARIYGDFGDPRARVPLDAQKRTRRRSRTAASCVSDRSRSTPALKGKCVMGDKADCDRAAAGVAAFYLRSLTDKKFILEDLAGEAVRAVKTRLPMVEA